MAIVFILLPMLNCLLLSCDPEVEGNDGAGDGRGGAAGETNQGGAGTPPQAEGGASSIYPPPLLFDGKGIQLGADERLDVEGSFFILEDSVKDDELVDGYPQLTFTNLIADTPAEAAEDPISRFTDATQRPCVSGTLARVTTLEGEECYDEAGIEAEDCEWELLWGGGIGVTLDQGSGGRGWNANAWGIRGFRFEIDPLNGPQIRFQIKTQGREDSYCVDLAPGQREIRFSQLTRNCYENPRDLSEKVDRDVLSQLAEIQFQLVASAKSSSEIDSFCVSRLEVVY